MRVQWLSCAKVQNFCIRAAGRLHIRWGSTSFSFDVEFYEGDKQTKKSSFDWTSVKIKIQHKMKTIRKYQKIVFFVHCLTSNVHRLPIHSSLDWTRRYLFAPYWWISDGQYSLQVCSFTPPQALALEIELSSVTRWCQWVQKTMRACPRSFRCFWGQRDISPLNRSTTSALTLQAALTIMKTFFRTA